MSEPTSGSPRPISEEDRRMIKEQEDIRLGVADVTFAWANVENCMVMVLAQILRDPAGNIASAIYFTPASIEIRMNIVDNTLRALTTGTSPEKPLLDRWRAVMERLNRLRKTRNKVAHGELVIFSGTRFGGGSFARLTAPMLKLDDDKEELLYRGQKPGMGSNELHQSAVAVNSTANRVIRFAEFVRLLQTGDNATLLQKLSEADDETQSPPDPNNPTPQAPESQPLPSPQ
jgi:hypothetical protein